MWLFFFFPLSEWLLIKRQITSIHRASTTDDRQVATKLCEIVFHMYLDHVPSVYFISIFEQFWSFLEHISISYSKFFLYTASDQVAVLYQTNTMYSDSKTTETYIDIEHQKGKAVYYNKYLLNHPLQVSLTFARILIYQV